MFSHQERVWVQLRQWERGWTMLSPSGQRLRHTLRKLPKARPRTAANVVPRMRIMCELSIRFQVMGGLNVLNPRCPKARHLRPKDEDLSLGTPDLGYPI